MRIRRFFFRVQRIFDFARLGYYDFDFDHHYFHAVMLFKLDCMIKHWEESPDIFVGQDKTLMEMKEFKLLLERWTNMPPFGQSSDWSPAAPWLSKHHDASFKRFCAAFEDESNWESMPDGGSKFTRVDEEATPQTEKYDKLYNEQIQQIDAHYGVMLGRLFIKSRGWWI